VLLVPISLAVVLIVVGRRRIARNGVGMPGHFLVRVQKLANTEPVLRGSVWWRKGSAELNASVLDCLFNGQMELQDEHLRNVSEQIPNEFRNLKRFMCATG
jgi:regulator of sirC expression with transglutaminase-like and TPR domain